MLKNKSRKLVALLTAVGCGAIATPAAIADTPQPISGSVNTMLLAQASILNTIPGEISANNSAFSTLLTAVTTAGLGGALSGSGPFTVFAPTNEAFAKLPSGTVQSLLQPQNRAQLTRILTYHVVPGRISTIGLTPGQTITVRTLQGSNLTVRVIAPSQVTVNNIPVEIADIPASNGVIHAIGGVLLP